MKHLNVERNEVTEIIINFELNKFVAYVKLNTGSIIVYLTAYTLSEIYNSDETQKYMVDWAVPVTISPIAERLANKK